MKIITSWNASQSLSIEPEGVVFAFGAFDGIHLGHQILIKKMKAMAQEKGLKTALLAFSNHPLEVLFAGRSVPRITSNSMRRQLLETLGIDYLFELPFTDQLASFEPEEFVSAVLSIVPVKVWVAGEDVTFGRGRRGNVQVLEILAMKSGFKVEIVKKRESDQTVISSSSIRASIAHGEFNQAQILLGRPYSFMCEPVRGVIPGRKEEPLTLMLYVDGAALPPVGDWKVAVRGQNWIDATVTIELKPEIIALHFQDKISHDSCKNAASIEIMFSNDL